MKPFTFPVIFAVMALMLACSLSSSDNGNNNKITAKPSPKPSLSSEELLEKNSKDESEQAKAFNDFVDKNYKGWVVQGISNGNAAKCDENLPCDLYLTKGKQSKVVAVILKQFYRADGSAFWAVFAARSIDLALAKIADIKERQEQATLENLDSDQCSEVCEADRAEQQTAADDHDYDSPY